MLHDQLLDLSAPSLNIVLAIVIVACPMVLLLAEWRSSLRRIAGPSFARMSNFYLFANALKGNMHVLFGKLHQKYGDLVRVGLNKVALWI